VIQGEKGVICGRGRLENLLIEEERREGRKEAKVER
jgi:hypothetical protein